MEDRQRFEDHLGACEGCTRYLDQMRTTIRTTGRLREDHISSGARDRLLGAFRSWKRRDRASAQASTLPK